MQEVGPEETWYVVICKPRQESVAVENLARQNFGVYLPRIQMRKRRAGRWIDSVEPLFPRYLFIKFNMLLQSAAPIRSTLGVVGLLRFAQTPAVVPDAVISVIQAREDAATGLLQDQRQQFKVGEAVQVIDGPLKGLEGVFNQVRGDGRVMVLLELLGQMNRVVIERDWVMRAG
jgi:transcriptional antiterminator RfaH